ncbi:MAG TPA: TonB-dependent receptor [Steroidobacteraceae bacterium]|nr:TonB-dependent receptor [Steroidobacteraceae bacterium]
MKRPNPYLLVCLAALGPVWAVPCLAAGGATRADGPSLRYEAQWYQPFAPRTALDMVQRTPGFTLDEGQSRRGLSGAVGNVLVDGRRPSAKEQTLEEILQRIPAAQVQAIEILRGAQTAGDASGQAVLLNVVRTPFTGQGVGSMGVEYAQQHRAMPNGFMAWTGRAHAVDYAVGAATYSLRRELPGTRELLDAAKDPSGTRRDASPRDFAEYTLNGESAFALGESRLRLTGQAHEERYHEDSTIDTFGPGGNFLESDFNPYTENRRNAELGGHLERSVGRWNLAGVLLLTRNRFESEVSSTHTGSAGVVESVYTQQLSRDSGESILRGTLARGIGDDGRIEIGTEIALNTLDAALIAAVQTGGAIYPLHPPNSNVRIEETRAESFVNYSWRIDERWAFDWSLAGEFSRLQFSGDSEQVVELAYAKPSLQLARSFGTAHQWRVRVFRDVGQLDFKDFVSSLSLSDERIEGGNPDLKPQTSWNVELAADLRPSADLALTLTAFHRWLRDTADFAPVGPPDELVDAPGNIGDGRVYGMQLTARVPLKFLPGASLTFDGTRQFSRVTDPLTGRTRGISRFQDWQLKTALRQDRPRYTWGLDYAHKSMTTAWLLQEIDRERASPSLDAYLEIPLCGGLRLRFAAVSLLGQPELRERWFHAPDRRGAFDHAELARRDPGTWYQLSISGNF